MPVLSEQNPEWLHSAAKLLTFLQSAYNANKYWKRAMYHNMRYFEHSVCGCAHVQLAADRAESILSGIRVCYSSKLYFMGAGGWGRGAAERYFKILVTGFSLATRKLGHTWYRCPSLRCSQAVYVTGLTASSNSEFFPHHTNSLKVCHPSRKVKGWDNMQQEKYWTAAKEEHKWESFVNP